MTQFELDLEDRIAKIRAIDKQHDLENNGVIFYSGGIDSEVMRQIFLMAKPNHKIPTMYTNTGIEYKMMLDYVKEKQKEDSNIIIVNAGVNIPKMLEEVGYPFKSKEHSYYVEQYQKHGIDSKTVQRYINPAESRKEYGCPKKLRYQFEEEEGLPFKCSNKCCERLKKEPAAKWMEENNRSISITGMRAAEGGNRANGKCVVWGNTKNTKDKLKKFNPLMPLSDEFMKWFMKEYSITPSPLYLPPFNFTRSGCAGCCYNKDFKRDFEIIKQYAPIEHKKCEYIWKPVYAEMRRIGYRIKKEE